MTSTLRLAAVSEGTGEGAVTATGPLLLTKADLAAELRTSTKTIDRMDSSGKLPRAIRLSGQKRWRREEILAWVAGGCIPRAEWERFTRRK
jgi:predicted DNA-binding transcriptional regulator AlpA